MSLFVCGARSRRSKNRVPLLFDHCVAAACALARGRAGGKATSNGTGHLGEAFALHIENLTLVTIVMQVICPSGNSCRSCRSPGHSPFEPTPIWLSLPCNLRSPTAEALCVGAFLNPAITIMMQVIQCRNEPSFRQMTTTGHISSLPVATRATTIELILIASKIPNLNQSWRILCSNRFAYYETCNRRVHKTRL